MANQNLDQAKTLRSMSRELHSQSRPRAAAAGKPPRVISVTSGKGGVGKTALVANLAVLLARQGKKVLIIDADLGLANIDVVLGLTPQYNLNHFFAGEKQLNEIMVEGPEGIRILPAGSGVQNFTHLTSEHKLRFLEGMDALHGDHDLVLIDTEAGISENVTYFNVAAQEILVVTTPDPTAITDAYALMKLLSTNYHEKAFKLVVNAVRDEDEALEVYKKLTLVSNRYLNISIDYLGHVPFDKKMREAISRQRSIVDLFPGSKPSVAFTGLARQLDQLMQTPIAKGTNQLFWQRLLSMGSQG